MSDDSTPTETLPSIVPNLAGLAYIDIVADKFTYGLTVDRYAFGYWAEKVGETDTYIVTDIDTFNASKFSSFLITHQCVTEAENDGCCMVSENLGGVCLIRGSSATEMNTYRFTNSQWETITSAFSSSQTDYVTEMTSLST